jgi:hypothetical protein
MATFLLGNMVVDLDITPHLVIHFHARVYFIGVTLVQCFKQELL